MSTLWHILLVAGGVGFLIFIHELGHFLVAKWVGVRVERFSLGFGPVLAGFRRGETEYVLSWIPLGGYVKMTAENPGETASGDPRGFANRPVWERAAIASAGITMNALTAVAAFTLAFQLGVQALSPVVGGTETVGEDEPSWPAWEAGIREGDTLLAIGDAPVRCFEDLLQEVALQQGAVVPVTVSRAAEDGRPVERRFEVARRLDPSIGIPKIGISPLRSTWIAQVAKDQKILQKGDRVLAVEGEPVATWRDLERRLAARAGQATALTVARGGKPVDLSIALPRASTIGVQPLARIVVTGVAAERPAKAAGIRKGDQILSVDGRSLTTEEAFHQALQAGELHPLSIVVRKSAGGGGGTETPLVEPEQDPAEGKRVLGLRYRAEPALPMLADPSLGTPAHAVGLRGGDLLVAVDVLGTNPVPRTIPVNHWSDLEQALEEPSPIRRLTLHFHRRGSPGEARIEGPLKGSLQALGLSPAILVGVVQPGSPAERLGLSPGDRLRYLRLADDPGTSRSRWPEMLALVQDAGLDPGSGPEGSEPLRLDWVREDPALPSPQIHDQDPVGVVPADPASPFAYGALGAYPDAERIQLKLQGTAALAAGLKRTRDEAFNIYRTVRSFFAPREQAVSAKNLGGVITIVMGADQSLESGPGAFLLFLGIISVNLAVLNLLPIPVLDGGLLLVLAIEKLRGSPLSDRTQAWFQYAGLALLLPLVLFVTYNDIAHRLVPLFR